MEGIAKLKFRSSTSIAFLAIMLALTILTTKAQIPSQIYQDDDCNTTAAQTLTRAYQTNLDIILSWLTSSAGTSKGYNRTAINTGTNPNYTVYGVFDCVADVDRSFCQFCISTATREMQERCPNRVSLVIWYDYCILRYSNKNFFGNLILRPGWTRLGSKNVSNPTEVNTTENYMRSLIRKATNETNQLFAMGEFYLSNGEKRYGMVHCSRDLNRKQCAECLETTLGKVPKCCVLSLGWQVSVPSCLVRYQDYSFYVTANAQTTPLLS